MVKAKASKVEETPAAEQQTIVINKQEFIRTRDALITSWVTLEGALRDATRAYISHSNAVLGGTEPLDVSKLDLTQFLAGVPLPVPGEEDDDKKKKKERKAKAVRDPTMPKRPLTSYLLWLQDHRGAIHSELGQGQGRGAISSEGTRQWNTLPQSEKDRYQAIYRKNEAKYQENLAAWKAAKGLSAEATPAVELPGDEEEADGDEPVSAEAEADAGVASTPSNDESDEDDSEDEEQAPPKEPTPPPVKTPRSAPKSSRKKAAVKADMPASSPPLPASSPVKTNFTTVNGTANGKRKKDTKEIKAEAAEEPRKKRTKKETAAAPAPAPAAEPPVESAKKEKRERRRVRKSLGTDA